MRENSTENSTDTSRSRSHNENTECDRGREIRWTFAAASTSDQMNNSRINSELVSHSNIEFPFSYIQRNRRSGRYTKTRRDALEVAGERQIDWMRRTYGERFVVIVISLSRFVLSSFSTSSLLERLSLPLLPLIPCLSSHPTSSLSFHSPFYVRKVLCDLRTQRLSLLTFPSLGRLVVRRQIIDLRPFLFYFDIFLSSFQKRYFGICMSSKFLCSLRSSM